MPARRPPETRSPFNDRPSSPPPPLLSLLKRLLRSCTAPAAPAAVAPAAVDTDTLGPAAAPAASMLLPQTVTPLCVWGGIKRLCTSDRVAKRGGQAAMAKVGLVSRQ